MVKMKWFWCAAVLLAAVATAEDNEEELPWWKTGIFYQIYPRSFKDSNGDGIGDLRGIIEMAEYFPEIGVNAVWMSPISPSPNVDNGYDISDFKAIEPTFGNMADYEELVQKLHRLGMKIVFDFVPNHTSDKHPWFNMSINNKTNPDYSDFYVWVDPKWVDGKRQPPNNWIGVFGGSSWEWNEQRKQYYLHHFTKQQPDLNLRNPYVVGNLTEIMDFWLSKGVDGFRMDAVKFYIENNTWPDEPKWPGTAGDKYNDQQHIYSENQPETYQLIKKWADRLYEKGVKEKRTRAMFLEIYDSIPMELSYYGKDNDLFEFPFNFNILDRGSLHTNPGDLKAVIDQWLAGVSKGSAAAWVVANHDNIRPPDRYGPEMTDAIQLLSGVLPGMKCLYYGEEIGMQDTFIRWEQTQDPRGLLAGSFGYLSETRDPERTPMQWDDNEPCAGFSTNSTPWLPINPNYWWLNVKAQREAPVSHLKVFQALAKARKHPVLQRGDYEIVVPDNNDTMVIIRKYKGEHFVLLINWSSQVKNYTSHDYFKTLNLDTDCTVVTTSLQAPYKPGTNFNKGGIFITLRPKAAILLRSGHSEEAKQPPDAHKKATTSPAKTPKQRKITEEDNTNDTNKGATGGSGKVPDKTESDTSEDKNVDQVENGAPDKATAKVTEIVEKKTKTLEITESDSASSSSVTFTRS